MWVGFRSLASYRKVKKIITTTLFGSSFTSRPLSRPSTGITLKVGIIILIFKGVKQKNGEMKQYA